MISGATLRAQEVNIFQPDSAKVYPQKKTRFLFSFDARRSFVNGQGARFWGLRLGFERNWRHRFGIGLYGLADPVELAGIRWQVPGTDTTDTFLDTSSVNFSFNYNSLFYERVIFRNRKWEASVPLHLGFGRIRGTFIDRFQRPWTVVNAPVALLEMSAVGHHNIWPWFAIGGGVGYRALLLDDNRVTESFNAPIYLIKAKLMVGPLYKAIFKQENKDPDKEI